MIKDYHIPLPSPEKWKTLTPLEQEAVRFYAMGHTIKATADQFYRTPVAIATRLRQAKRKLGIGCGRVLARYLEGNNFFTAGLLLLCTLAAAQPCDNTLPRAHVQQVAYAVADGLVLRPQTACHVVIDGDGFEELLGEPSASAYQVSDGWMLGCGDRLLVAKPRHITVEFTLPVCFPGEQALPEQYRTGCAVVINRPTYWASAVEIASAGGADFDCDGDRGTDADIAAFWACLGIPGCPGADFNQDGDSGTDDDIDAFYRALGSP